MITYDKPLLNGGEEEGTSFRIRENMKAGVGVTFREGDSHVDQGPTI